MKESTVTVQAEEEEEKPKNPFSVDTVSQQNHPEEVESVHKKAIHQEVAFEEKQEITASEPLVIEVVTVQNEDKQS